MNTPNLGKYASVCDLPYTTQKINYNRGYGNIVKYNRIDPLQMPFASHLPAPNSLTGEKYQMFNPETTIAWADKRFYE